MSNNYLTFFKLSENPFKLTPDPNYYFFSKDHKVAIETLLYFYNSDESFAVITGYPGVGKTITIRKFIEEINDKVEIAYIIFPNLSPVELFMAILEDLKIQISENITKNKLFSVLRDYLIKKKKEGKKVIVIVDEAQNMPVETLEELRIISNLETKDEKLIKILLVGQEELLSKIQSQELKQLRQRITIFCHIKPLNFEQTKKYVLFRIHKAAGQIDISEKAFKTLYKITQGNPRLINQIMERALIAAFLEELQKIDKQHIISAAKSLEINVNNQYNKKVAFSLFMAIFIILSASFGVYKFLLNQKENNKNQDNFTKITLNPPQVQEKPKIEKNNENTVNNKVYILYLLASKDLNYLTNKKKELESKIKNQIYITKIKNGNFYALALFFDNKEEGLRELEKIKKLTGIKDIFITNDKYTPDIVKQP
jgi:general secretion pathway protein A